MTDQREAELNPNRGTARFECSRRGDRAPETDQVAQPVGRNRSGANQGGPEDSIRMKLRTDWQKSFAQPDNPAPRGNETLTYLTRNVNLYGSKLSKTSYTSFRGKLLNEREDLRLKFKLRRADNGNYFDLEITDVACPFESSFSLARFQQADLVLNFMKHNEDGSFTVEHEEPSVKVSLDLPNSKWHQEGGWSEFAKEGGFTVTCYNVVPAKKFENCLQKRDNLYMGVMRLYMKLVAGELDVLHGVQKCFHPDKDLLDIRDQLENSLTSGNDSDAIIISGENVGFRVHRMILNGMRANSDVFCAMFQSGMSEARTNRVLTPSFATTMALEAFLKFLYARNRKHLELDPATTIATMRLAHFFNVPSLVEVCEESMLAMDVDLFCMESCLEVFLHAALLERTALETKVVHIMIRKNIKLSGSHLYIEFLKKYPAIAARMIEMIVEFKNSKLVS